MSGFLYKGRNRQFVDVRRGIHHVRTSGAALCWTLPGKWRRDKESYFHGYCSLASSSLLMRLRVGQQNKAVTKHINAQKPPILFKVA